MDSTRGRVGTGHGARPMRGRARRAHRAAAVVALILAAVALAGCTQSADRRLIEGYYEEVTEQPFYTLPSPVPPGAPGDILRTEQLSSAPDGTIGYRVLYHTTDVMGTDVVASGILVAPSAPPPAGGRAVVGWGHFTTGAARECAPSNGIDPFDMIEGLDALMEAGYAVAAADYPGMGVDGPNSYLIGTSEGNSILDAIRAAASMPEIGVGDAKDVVLWGHSQGGQAVLFAAQSAAQYAPELKVHGAAVAAPAADLGTLLSDDITDISGVTIGSYAFSAYQSVYSARYPGLSLSSILTPEGAAATPTMAGYCLFTQTSALHDLAGPLVGHYVSSDPATTEPWATMLKENTPGTMPTGMPLLVAQGEADTLVLPAATRQFVATQCAAGVHVIFNQYANDTHGTVGLAAMPAVSSFLAAVLAGAPPASTC